MMAFITGVPVIEFFNYQTKEIISLMDLIDFDNYGEEIEIKTASLPEKVNAVRQWLKDWNAMIVKVKFKTYQGDTEGSCHKVGEYTENYRLLTIEKPFVSNASLDSTGEFKTRMRVERL